MDGKLATARIRKMERDEGVLKQEMDGSSALSRENA